MGFFVRLSDVWDASVRKHGGLAALGAKLRAAAERKVAAAASREAREAEACDFLRPLHNSALDAFGAPADSAGPPHGSAAGGIDAATKEALGMDLMEPHFFTAVCGPYVNAFTASSAAGRAPPIADIAVRARRWVGFPSALAAGLGVPAASMTAFENSRPDFFDRLRKVRRAGVWRGFTTAAALAAAVRRCALPRRPPARGPLPPKNTHAPHPDRPGCSTAPRPTTARRR
jgi:hypothetical protein